MSFARKCLVFWITPVLLVGLAGCSGNMKQVSGTLKYKGEPVPNAYVTFTPDNGRPSWGETDEQGRFTLHYDNNQDGATAGTHKVSVRPKPTANTVTEPGKPLKLPKDIQAFYDKYAGENSKKEVTIDKDESNLILDWD
jgi:hypothetical protein